jgi:hypothetical protein
MAKLLAVHQSAAGVSAFKFESARSGHYYHNDCQLATPLSG